MNRKGKTTIALISTAHAVLDSYSSFLFQLLPVMTVRLGLKPAQAGWLTPMLMISSSLMQPVYGMISDRYLKRSMAVFGPLVAAVFLSLLGTATNLPMLMAFVVIGGIGVGAFHPQGAALVSRAASTDGMSKHQGMVMSVFSSSGTVGYALGPILIAAVVSQFGLEHSWYAMAWGMAMWVLMYFYCPPLERVERKAGTPHLKDALQVVWKPLTMLYFAVVLRSAVAVSVQTFLPFALQSSGLTDNERSWVLAGFILFGGIGGFFGGALADRLGARRVTIIAMLLATPLLLASFSTQGMPSYLLLMAGGTALNLPIPIAVVMAQRLVPGGASTVSALVMGFAWGAGALMAPLTGLLSARIGFFAALFTVSFLPLISAVLLWRYPKDEEVARFRVREAMAMGD
jgi:MFS transporter, FSR family, fosmidomycin resistance protein